MHEIEKAIGDLSAIRVAWLQARDAYLAYRRQGGYAQSGGGKLADHVLGLVAQQKANEIELFFNRLADDPERPETRKQLMQAVINVLSGTRDPALADDPALSPLDAAEILFLIDRLTDKP